MDTDDTRWELVGIDPRGQRIKMVVREENVMSLEPRGYMTMPRLLLGFVPSGYGGNTDGDLISSGLPVQDVTYDAATLEGKSVEGLKPYVVVGFYDMIMDLNIESWKPLTN